MSAACLLPGRSAEQLTSGDERRDSAAPDPGYPAMTIRTILATALALGLTGTAAVAQSYNAPAGIPAGVAPGGLEGRAALPNIDAATPANGRVIVRDDELATGSVRTHQGQRPPYGR